MERRTRPATFRPMIGVLVACVVMALPAAAQTSRPDRFTVVSEGHPMAVWARSPAVPKATLLLVHGRTWSSRPDFDLQVPGLQRSVMAALASAGIATYAVDLRGYGETPRDASGWLTPRRAATDIVAVANWIAARHPTLPKPAVGGWSRGAAMAMMAVQALQTRASALIMFGFVFDPDGVFTDGSSPARPLRSKNTAAAAASDFISPAVTPKAVIQAFVAQALAADPIAIDLRGDAEFNGLNPRRVTVPTLVIYGDRDPGVDAAEARKFVATLATPEKSLVILPGGDHAAQIEDTHASWVAAVSTFVLKAAAR